MSRRAAREAALRALYQIDVGRSSHERALAYNADEMGLDENARRFARSLIEGTLANLSQIDGVIAKFSQNWSVERLARTDRNILRMAIYELLFQDQVPESVAINEAVELAKAYGDVDSAKFINGILGQLVRNGPRQTQH